MKRLFAQPKSQQLKRLFSLASFLLLVATAIGQEAGNKYDSIAALLSNELLCCPLQIQIGEKNFQSIKIEGNGGLVFENDKGDFARANLFNLYKIHRVRKGFYRDANQIVFQVDEKEKIVLEVDSAYSNRIYQQFEELFQAGKNHYRPSIELDRQQTLDSINRMLKKWTYYKPSIEVSEDGAAVIAHAKDQFLRFNFNKLSNNEGMEIRGIEVDFHVPGSHGLNNWINFQQNDNTVAFMKFGGVPDDILNQLHRLFVHLSSLTDNNN